jgi:signal transduction histidine kinase
MEGGLMSMSVRLGGDADSVPIRPDREALAEIRLRIVSNFTHELRAPLTALRGYTNTVLQERAGPINPRQREYLGIVLDRAERLANLMNWMGKLLLQSEEDLTLARCDLRALWMESKGKNADRLAAKSLTLREKLPPEEVSITCDCRKIALALDALLAYALRSADHGESIEVEVSGPRSGKVLFKVSCPGDPASTDFLKKIFECQEPLEPSSSEDTGLTALANARDIISLHGGMTSITESDRKGITAIITLPVIGERSVSNEGEPNPDRR